MKFKIGDKVKIIDNPSIKECGYCVCDMNKTISKTGKIVEIYSKRYKVKIDNVIWNYPEFALKKVNILPDNLFTLE
jgi:ribosomal protein L21E